MAVKKTTRKKTVRKKAATGRSAKKKATASRTRRKAGSRGPAQAVGAVIDREIAGLSRRMESSLRQFAGGVDRAQLEAGREAAPTSARGTRATLQDSATRELGAGSLLRDSRKELSGLLTRLEKTVKPKAARKKATGKKATGKKKTVRKPVRKKKATKKPARKVARKKAPSRRR